MKKISQIGSSLKKIYRYYNNTLLISLQERGFIDLRASFLEILIFLSEEESPSIKAVGEACGLKKQTMTSHLNELEKRGYIQRSAGLKDKREIHISLTESGQKFRVVFNEVIADLEAKYQDVVGEIEMDRLLHSLESYSEKIRQIPVNQILLEEK